MGIRVGRVAGLARYPVKSMAGTSLAAAFLGWNGLLGDRRFAFRRLGETGGFPWLTARRFPQLVLYQPCGHAEADGEPRPTHVLTPEGARLDLMGEALRREIGARFGKEVEMVQLQHGIFDDAVVSVISAATVARVCGQAGVEADSRRFRPNIVVDCDGAEAFAEDGWVGSLLILGEEASGSAIYVTKRDERCMMINLDPETARQDAGMLKAAVRLNDTCAGVYGTVVRVGPIRAGDPVTLVPGLAAPRGA